MKTNVVLVGLGPHAKRIYMQCFKDNHIQPVLIIEVQSKANEVTNYIEVNKLPIKTYFINDKYRYSSKLSKEDNRKIIEIIQSMNITHAIISTEPKAHYMYLCFFLKHNINVLVDKPLTAPINVSTDVNRAMQIEKDYKIIKKLYTKAKKNNTILQIQCQRRWHKGYRFVHNLANEIVEKYQIPITAIQLSHCDGMWNMPDEFITRENHPYKYGYGKLFHSGYHFIDLLSWFEGINDILEDKRPNNIELYASAVKPSDFMQIINKNNYNNIFNSHKYDSIFDNIDKYKFEKFGELDIYSILQFKKDDKVISTANISLMQDGFSRRSWEKLPEDTYKSNGRVRHEYMNIEIGPLMNIQIHSYQSKEIKDRIKGKLDIGEVEHFNVYVFKNIDLIGGQPLEKYTLRDFFENEKQMLGYNESAREACFREFVEKKVTRDTFLDHELGIRILAKEYEALSNKYEGKTSCLCFNI
ncbi:Gfo/Idh/MocA family oxidoreductase [Anaerosacchariphilus polymeriproducens]|uniref:Gfo/Idh/MocA-like oxidoreductase N-terminal domain-containing protein n=1 Tax=Anaerosacchariphilus polymeriproducens TaxID=1812858 RepID=A0A371AS53_9FIRM|nr:Gfo/Idh/MocA family oxidoreductase [Anaerosacchariphilus polymeriproducens]RDU22384.1 hypothetical protein DWV06_13890 [Anaerosacchariphilus polymeriproducens]